uniref:DNA polymerase n=1 Tax=Globodera pallida TaxID=36090 RepID=A0A183CEG6_GLOPA
MDNGVENKTGNDYLLLGMGNPLLDLQRKQRKAIANIDFVPGGSAQNTVRVCQWMIKTFGGKARSCYFFGAVGKDKFGEILHEKAQAADIETRYQEVPNEKSGTCAVLVFGDKSAAANQSLIEQISNFYVEGYFLTVSLDSILCLATHAAASDRTKHFALNLSAEYICQFFGDQLEKVLPFVDILFGNEQEAKAYAKTQAFVVEKEQDVGEIALHLCQKEKVNRTKKRIVVITQGHLPVLVAHDGKLEQFPVESIPASQIVDTNGAGDAFCGGFLAAFSTGRSMDLCVRAGTFAARTVIQHVGCTLPAEYFQCLKLKTMKALWKRDVREEAYRKRVDDLVDDLYMEVDDAEYEAKKREHRSFVENDGADYYDEDDSEDEFYDEERATKKSKGNKKAKPKAGTIKHHFQVTNKRKPQDENCVRVDDDDILKECLADIIGMGAVGADKSFDPFTSVLPSSSTSLAAFDVQPSTSDELNKFRVPSPIPIEVDDEEPSLSSGNSVTKDDLFDEVQRVLRTKFGITKFNSQPELITKKFISADESVPKECQALEVWVNSNAGRISSDLCGEYFSHVMNTTTTALERLMVECEIYGPCWLNVQNAVSADSPVSYCPLEYDVDMDRMKSISMALNCAEPIPPISMISMNVLTALNPETKESQIVMVSLIEHSCNLEKCTNFDAKLMLSRRYCVVAKLKKGLTLPFDLDDQLKAGGISQIVRKVGDEISLLNMFLLKMEEINPDMILGHDLNAQLIILQTAVERHKLKRWDRFGRLKRSINIQRNCRNGNDARSKNRVNLSMDQISEPFLETNPTIKLVDLIKWNWNENFFAMKIVEHLNAIALFVQITQIVGGVMSRTLMGGRAERNEYLLLHACFRADFVPPDKHSSVASKAHKPQKLNKEQKGSSKGQQNVLEVEVVEITEIGREALSSVGTGVEEHLKKVTTQSKKAQYTGGLVLEPMKGLYETFIVLLDFNSLYPSIIQEFNICFTTVDNAFDDLLETELPTPPGSSRPDGILKTEIRKLVNRRREVKELMNKEKAGSDKYKQYNIRQMGLKLTANSMYGCLGFQYSRFYAKTLAAMITAKGRELLLHTKHLVENEHFSVIYGDTDSIMVNTNSTDFVQAKQIGQRLKQIVNRNYSLLELDIDGIYKRLLLLKKKKYAALAVDPNDEHAITQELKGLDIVRRDWSQLAKEIGEEVVNLILSSVDRDTLVERIRETLAERRADIEAGRVSLDKFEILKQLTRNPSEYKDTKAQPHALVAIRLNESKKFRLRQGDVVNYVICKDGSDSPATQRAYHPSEILGDENLSVDIQYYLAYQIHPVVSRLCEPIEEIDACQIAEIIGLDPASYRRKHAEAQMNKVEPADFSVGRMQEFVECVGFSFECPFCKKFVVLRNGIAKNENGQRVFCLAQCFECQRELKEHSGDIQRRLIQSLNAFVKRNLQDPFVCDDVVCGTECVMPSPSQLSADGIVCAKCQGGIMRKKYAYKRLYDQQCFFKTITSLVESLPERELKALSVSSKSWMVEHYAECEKIVDRYLDQNAFNKVDLAQIFSPLIIEGVSMDVISRSHGDGGGEPFEDDELPPPHSVSSLSTFSSSAIFPASTHLSLVVAIFDIIPRNPSPPFPAVSSPEHRSMGGCCACLRIILFEDETADIRINVVEPTTVARDRDGISGMANGAQTHVTRLVVPLDQQQQLQPIKAKVD